MTAPRSRAFVLPGAAAPWPGTVASPRHRESGAFRAFGWLVAIYTALLLSKLNEMFPLVGRMQPSKIVGALLLVGAFLVMRERSVITVLRSSPARWVGVFVALALLSVPGAVWPGGSVEFLTHEFWKTLVFFVIAATAWCDRGTLWRSVVTLVASTAVVAVALVVGDAQAMQGRVYVGTSLDPNESALRLLVVIPFALYLASQGRYWSLVGGASALVMVAGVVQTGSRGAFLGLVVMGVWLLHRARGRWRWLSLAAVVGGTVVVALTVRGVARERLSTVLHLGQDYNVTYQEGRLPIWKRGLGYMADHPLLGVGVYDFPVAEGVLSEKRRQTTRGVKYSDAHNIFVQVGAELGVIGLLAFAGMLWTAAGGCRRVRRLARLAQSANAPLAKAEASLATAALGAMVGLVVGGFFLSVAYDPVVFFVTAICIAVRLGSPLGPPAAPAVIAPRRAGQGRW